MKRAIKWIVIVLLLCVAGLSLLWSFYTLRRQMITDNWSEPTVHFSNVRHSMHPDQTTRLIHYYYTLTQTAKLRYPHYVWKNSAWESQITDRHNTIAKGYGMSIVEGVKVHILPVDKQIDEVLWFNASALCRTENGWIRVTGNKHEDLPASFIPPQGHVNALSEPDLMLPTTAEKYSEIAQSIRDKNLGAKGRRNYYKPMKDAAYKP